MREGACRCWWRGQESFPALLSGKWGDGVGAGVERGAARGRDEVDPGAGCGGPAEGLLLALALWYTRRE